MLAGQIRLSDFGCQSLLDQRIEVCIRDFAEDLLVFWIISRDFVLVRNPLSVLVQVMVACAQNGYALMYAELSLRSDPEVVGVALQQTGWALKHAAPALQEDRDMVLLALQSRQIIW